MDPIRLDDVIEAVQGALVRGAGDGEITGVKIDSRSIEPGDLFFAFCGEKADGHDFLEQAFQRGAAAAVISHPVAGGIKAPLIMVSDPVQALQELARFYRSSHRIPVVAVTGSSGKTTTKDLIAAVLGRRFHVLKTEGNYNNELGLPLTLLRLDRGHQAAVVEMAMRGQGQISALCEISRPQVGVLTIIGKSHLELLGSQEAIAQAKGELLQSLPADGCAVLNGDDPWQIRLAAKAAGDIIFYGGGDDCQIRANQAVLRDLDGVDFILSTPAGRVPCSLPLPGLHNVANALAAAAVGYRFGLTPEEIAAGLQSVSPTGMRLEIKPGLFGTKLIDDSYNANPSSAVAALRLLASSRGAGKIAVLGEMYELGAEEIDGHREVGRTAAALKIDCLCTVGRLAREIAAGALSAGLDEERVHCFREKAEAVSFLKSYIQTGDVVLIKGSRGMRMEEITASLLGGDCN
jgi:UDP-N-acetylmuramoyl-tripeptide--D-alanyl-D-alanine ligase